MPFDSPFTLGPFIVDDGGRLAPSTPDFFPSFHLCWRNRWIRVALTNRPTPEHPTGTLVIDMDLGRVPSTAGADPVQRSAQREQVFALLHALRITVPTRWRVTLLADHRVTLKCTEQLLLPATAVELVTDLTMLLFTLDPYIDLVDEAGLGTGAAGSGACKAPMPPPAQDRAA